MSAETISVEVAYALPDQQTIVALTVVADATVQDVIHASGLLEQYPEIDLEHNKVGVFGKLGNPKEVRKQRAAAGKVMKKGGGATDSADQG